jgi:hypothetical protein
MNSRKADRDLRRLGIFTSNRYPSGVLIVVFIEAYRPALERTDGVEPTSPTWEKWRSAAELRPRKFFNGTLLKAKIDALAKIGSNLTAVAGWAASVGGLFHFKPSERCR